MNAEVTKEWSEAQIADAVKLMANRLDSLYSSSSDPVCVVPILKGALFFATDLIRAVTFETEVYPLTATSYDGRMTPGQLVLEGRVPSLIAGRRVLIVDDIFDTGQTHAAVKRHVDLWKPSSVNTAVLLFKGGATYRRNFYNGFHAPPGRFFFGYGMDFREKDRSLKDIWSVPKGDE